MSYILNALRKSEQERNAEKAEFSPLIALGTGDSPQRSKFIWIMAVFLLVNLIVLGYLFYRLQQPVQTVVIHEQAAMPPVRETVSQLPVKPKSEAPKKISVAQKSGAPQSISDLLAATPKIVPRPPVKPPENKLSNPSATQSGRAALKPINANKSVSNVSLQKAQATLTEGLNDQPKDFAPIVQKPPAPKPNRSEYFAPVVTNNIPLLGELDGSFQSKVPAFTVNVLAYSDSPGERFVIVDMVKYKIGQRIKGDFLLKDILSDSLVFNYDGRDFRIEGP